MSSARNTENPQITLWMKRYIALEKQVVESALKDSTKKELYNELNILYGLIQQYKKNFIHIHAVSNINTSFDRLETRIAQLIKNLRSSAETSPLLSRHETNLAPRKKRASFISSLCSFFFCCPETHIEETHPRYRTQARHFK